MLMHPLTEPDALHYAPARSKASHAATTASQVRCAQTKQRERSVLIPSYLRMRLRASDQTPRVRSMHPQMERPVEKTICRPHYRALDKQEDRDQAADDAQSDWIRR